MDKGIKKIQRHVKKIEKANNLILDNVLVNVCKLKHTKLSDISYKNIMTVEILIHKDTNNFPTVKQKLLARVAELHIQYPFITLCFDPKSEMQPPKVFPGGRALQSQNENRLLLTVNWQDYMRYSLRGLDHEQSAIHLPRLGVQENLNDIKKKNWETLQKAINNILSKAVDHTLDEKSESHIELEKNTLIHEITRNHFMIMAQQIMKHYNGMIEIFNISSSTVNVRVHWNVYLSQISSQDAQQRQVPLLTDSSLDYLRVGEHSNYQVPLSNGTSGLMQGNQTILGPSNLHSPHRLPGRSNSALHHPSTEFDKVAHQYHLASSLPTPAPIPTFAPGGTAAVASAAVPTPGTHIFEPSPIYPLNQTSTRTKTVSQQQPKIQLQPLGQPLGQLAGQRAIAPAVPLIPYDLKIDIDPRANSETSEESETYMQEYERKIKERSKKKKSRSQSTIKPKVISKKPVKVLRGERKYRRIKTRKIKEEEKKKAEPWQASQISQISQKLNESDSDDYETMTLNEENSQQSFDSETESEIVDRIDARIPLLSEPLISLPVTSNNLIMHESQSSGTLMPTIPMIPMVPIKTSPEVTNCSTLYPVLDSSRREKEEEDAEYEALRRNLDLLHTPAPPSETPVQPVTYPQLDERLSILPAYFSRVAPTSS